MLSECNSSILINRQNSKLSGRLTTHMRFVKSVAAAIVMTVLVGSATAGEVFSAFPQTPANDQRYIIYLHGAIIERQGINPMSPQFGRYEFSAIIDALAQTDADVIALVREGGTETLALQIEPILSDGGEPHNITLVGFSKGGYITLLSANRLQKPDLRYVVMAGCVEGIVNGSDRSAEGLLGAVLSIVEATDDLGFACSPLFERNPQLSQTDDITFVTGAGHGFFYRADPAWIDEVLSWSQSGSQ